MRGSGPTPTSGWRVWRPITPTGPNNEVVRLDIAGSGFQDAVVLRTQFPHHPLWNDPLFSSQEYRRFAARAERALADVVTPDELTMQKYWPAQEAVAKLRHKASMAAIETSASRCGPVLGS